MFVLLERLSKTELSKSLLQFKPAFFYVAIFTAFINLLYLAPSIYMLEVYDRVLTSSNVSTLVFLSLIILFLNVKNYSGARMPSHKTYFKLALFIVFNFLIFSKSFAIGEELYDPEPPPNSSYLRIIHAGSVDSYNVSVDGKKRISNLKPALASQYLILTSGTHQIEMENITNPKKVIKVTVSVVPGHSFTYAFLDYAVISKPFIFDDVSISNRLKSQLMVYNLSTNINKIDLQTADGGTSVMSGIDKYTSKYLAVNPVEANVQLVNSDGKKIISKQSLKLTANTNLSIFLLSTPQGLPVVSQQLSTIEKYKRK